MPRRKFSEILKRGTFQNPCQIIPVAEFIFNPIQYGGEGQKDPPTSFSPVTSTNVGISPEKFLTFSFNPFCDTGVKFQVRI